jgi:CDGSH-type Zn-finger protein
MSTSGAQLRFYPNGPVLILGDFEMIGRDGATMQRTRATIALCRCGLSAITPYCDGSHKRSRFCDEPAGVAEADGSS